EFCDNGGICVGGSEPASTFCTVGGTQCNQGGTCTPQSGDGCNATCGPIESGWQCNTTLSPTQGIKCGNNRRERGSRGPTETCDDGNPSGGDGCSRLCQVESGYTCTAPGAQFPDGTTNNTSVEVCAKCGDGVKQSGEACDDFNALNDDGCNSQCQLELGFT